MEVTAVNAWLRKCDGGWRGRLVAIERTRIFATLMAYHYRNQTTSLIDTYYETIEYA